MARSVSQVSLSEFIARNKGFLVLFIVLISITLFTQYRGSTDIGDYQDSAKFLAGDYSARMRNTHSYMYGLLFSPLVGLFDSFIVFKLANLLLCFLLVVSLYNITRDRRAAWLMALSPILWYMAPWSSPIMLGSLFLLWAFYHMEKYQSYQSSKNLIFAGLLIGAGFMFWDALLYFIIAFFIAYLLDKKAHQLIIFATSVLIGLLPRLIFDQLMFNFAFYSIIKTFLAGFINAVYGGIYGDSGGGLESLGLVLFILSLPLHFWLLYTSFKERRDLRRPLIFIAIALVPFILNVQMRYAMAFAPLMILLLSKRLSEKSYNILRVVSACIICIVVIPYIIQIGEGVDNQVQGADIYYFVQRAFQVSLDPAPIALRMEKDLDSLAKDHPHERFLVGPLPDDYQTLADVYWGANIKEFVSLQDYELYMQNKTILFQKTFAPEPNFDDRRKIWIAGGISANFKGNESYESISRLISLDKGTTYPGFILEKSYSSFTVFKRE